MRSSVGVAVVDGLDLDPQLAVGAGAGDAGDPAMQAGERGGGDAAWQAAAVDDLGDGADARVLAVMPGNYEDALGVADVGGHRGGHRGEEDAVVERDQA